MTSVVAPHEICEFFVLLWKMVEYFQKGIADILPKQQTYMWVQSNRLVNTGKKSWNQLTKNPETGPIGVSVFGYFSDIDNWCI